MIFLKIPIIILSIILVYKISQLEEGLITNSKIFIMMYFFWLILLLDRLIN